MKLPRLPEMHIVRAHNGFIVKEVYSGEGILKEPYDKFLGVFPTINAALEFLKEWMGKVTL